MKKTLAFALLAVILGCSSDPEITLPPYTIEDQDISDDQATYRVSLKDRTDDSVAIIEIAKTLKYKSFKNKVVCFFHIYPEKKGFAWARVAQP